jgi:hypothetical protein
MEASSELMERFHKDMDIPIAIFAEPYFSSRLSLFEKQYQAKTKWDKYMEEVSKFKNEQEYFAYYNKVKDDAIKFIQETDAYKKFQEFDMNTFKVPNYNINRHDIFHHENDGKQLISIDLKKGNFTAMHWFDKSIVDNANTYEAFISKFSDVDHINKSKHIRQIIFGQCNPRRQTTIEKYLINMIISNIIIPAYGLENIEVYTDDEVILKLDNILETHTEKEVLYFKALVENYCAGNNINIHFERFTLHQIEDKHMFYKKTTDGQIDLKCVDALEMPKLIRSLNGEEPNDDDNVFVYNGRLAKFLN